MDRLGLAGRAGLQSEATREQAELVPLRVGLAVQELLLRHRARTALVVCPAPWCVKWRDEMAEKFGLEFRIVDAECRTSSAVPAEPTSTLGPTSRA